MENKKNGRPLGAKSEINLMKARAQKAMSLLEGIMSNQSADPAHRIQAASAVLMSAHYQQQQNH